MERNLGLGGAKSGHKFNPACVAGGHSYTVGVISANTALALYWRALGIADECQLVVLSLDLFLLADCVVSVCALARHWREHSPQFITSPAMDALVALRRFTPKCQTKNQGFFAEIHHSVNNASHRKKN
jgi:hypothetical protein